MNWDYLAGIFDGEGSIMYKPNGGVCFQISNTNREVLEEIKKFLKGGYIRFYDRKPGVWKPAGVYIITDHVKVLKILNKLKTRTIIKQTKVKEKINFIENKVWRNDILKINLIKARKLKKEGLSYTQIGKELGITRQWAWMMLNDYKPKSTIIKYH